MKKISIIILLSLSVYAAVAQTNKQAISKSVKKQFVGVWTLVSVENRNADSSITLPYGENPQGMLVFELNGDYAIQILKAVRPNVAANDKNKATAEENAALVQGNNSHFGTYSIDETKHAITFHVEHAFYPNWEGTVQVRSYTLENNLLRYVVTHTTNGGAVTAVVVWKKK
jgi:Lipocalin-like domain